MMDITIRVNQERVMEPNGQAERIMSRQNRLNLRDY